jgi:hypothetical protein
MKKFYSLALLATALLFGCSADGVFSGDPHNINYSSGSNPGNDPTGACTLPTGCAPNVSQSTCISAGGTFSLGACTSNESYCDIDGIGCLKIGSDCGVTSESMCNSYGYVEGRAFCLSYYGTIYCE